MLKRIGRWARLRPGYEEEYERWHREVWPSVLDAIKKAGITNYTIFRLGRDLFSYFEVADLATATGILNADDACQRWQVLMGPFMDGVDPLSPWTAMEEVFHLD